MLTVLALTIAIVGLAITGMAAGVLLGRTPIKGSCGGLSSIGLGCGSCEKPCEKRRRMLEQQHHQQDGQS